MAIETVMKQEEEQEELKRPLTRKEALDMVKEKYSHEVYIEMRWFMLAANCIYYNPNNNKGA
mgnify:FL=1